MRMFFQRLLQRILITCLWVSAFLIPLQSHASTFLSDFALPLSQVWWWGDERVYVFDNLDDEKNLIDNLKTLFFPDLDGWGGQIWAVIKNIAAGLLVLLLIRSAAKLLFSLWDPEKVKWAFKTIGLVLAWGLLIFFVIEILQTLLDVWWLEELWLDDWDSWSLIENIWNNLVLFILSLLKAAAYFVAIGMIVYYGIKIVWAFGDTWVIKTAAQWILNVVLALLFIKVIDYLFFLAANPSDFTDGAIWFIVAASKFVWVVLWILMVLALIYAWYLYITSAGEDDRISQASTLIKNVFIIVVITMLFLLIIYQIFFDLWI